MGKVVRKDLAFLVKGNLPVPTYVLEYLLGQYCASDDEEMIAAGLPLPKKSKVKSRRLDAIESSTRFLFSLTIRLTNTRLTLPTSI